MFDDYHFLHTNVRKSLVETIKLLNMKGNRKDILVISFRETVKHTNRLLIIYAPDNYVRVLGGVSDRRNKSLKLDLLGEHDTGWTEGISKFIDSLCKEIEEKGTDFFLNAMAVIALDSLPENLNSEIKYGFKGGKSFKCEFVKKLDLLLTQGMEHKNDSESKCDFAENLDLLIMGNIPYGPKS